MGRPKKSESFRLFTRNVNGRKLFYCRFLDDEGTIIATRSTGTEDEREAVIKALELEKAIGKNPLKTDPLLVDFLVNFWKRDSDYVRMRALEGFVLSNSYLEKNQAYIKNLCGRSPILGKIKLSQIAPRPLDRWKLEVASAGESRKGINMTINAIRVALRWAHKQGFIAKDPTDTFTYISYRPAERGVLNIKEMTNVEDLSWTDLRQKAALLLGFACGLRRGEIRALKWRSVDFETKHIHVVENYTDDDGTKAPKARSYRRVIMYGAVEAALEELKRQNPYGAEPDDYVLYNTTREKPVAAITLKRGFEKIMTAIGIDANARKVRRLVFHGMRHTFVTMARDEGLSEFAVSQMSGHRTVAMLENYSHQSEQVLEQVRAALAAAYEKRHPGSDRSA